MTPSRPRHARPGRTPRSAHPVELSAPVLAAGATIGAATSLTGVIAGTAWLAQVAVAVVLVGCTGLALRSVRTPAPLVPPAQLLVLLALVTGVFTDSGILAVVPGPAALAELDAVLNAAFEQIRTGVPPVGGTAGILCLVTLVLGLVAVVVDTLAVAASAPAATGLVLLCVYAVPSALADDLLPWWTFVLGAVGFTALLAVGGGHRGRARRERPASRTGAAAGAGSAPVTVVAAAVVAGLVAGSTVTAVGTEGSLPGEGAGRDVPGGLGVNPFTSLRGMLDRSGDVELFRVRGLGDEKRLLRAFTLDTYRPNEGWGLADGPMPAGVRADGALPRAPGDDGTAPHRTLRIDPVNWNDVWLPVYGSPRRLSGVADGWFYDRASGAVFRERRTRPDPYTEVASLEQPTEEELREAGTEAGDVGDVYVDDSGVDARVRALARRLTGSEDTVFDKVEAVWRHFRPGNGFVYDTETAPATDRDALADFLFNGRRGYCEQFASSMAVLLRTLDIPSRVAVGFTSGYREGDVRTITSRDAHAWVEVYFDGIGWVTFDPTPLSDGRGSVPPYLRSESDVEDTVGPDEPDTTTSATAPTPSAGVDDPGDTAAAGGGPEQGTGPWLGRVAAVLALAALLAAATLLWLRRGRERGPGTGGGPVLAVAVLAAWSATVLLAWWLHWGVAVALAAGTLAAGTPSAFRRIQRGRRLREIGAGTPSAGNAAWRELTQECVDRGIDIPSTDTIRLAAQRLAQRHRLDERGREDLRAVVTALERSWYSPDGAAGDRDPGFAGAFRGVLHALRRSAPLSWRARLWPRSIVRRRRT